MQTVPERFDRYIEPFAGSACLFFALRPPVAILADINEALGEVYTQLKLHPRLLARQVAGLGGKPAYYRVSRMDPATLMPMASDACIVTLKRYSYTGSYT